MKPDSWKIWMAGGVMALGVILAGAAAVHQYVPEQTRMLLAAGPDDAAAQDLPEMTVYKSPACGCCTEWSEHLREAGFQVTEEPVEDIMAVKERHGVPRELGSCHTALVGDYVVEGHVPAADIVRLLKERPDVRGLAVPGMPVGSPGMEVEGRPADPFASLTFDEDGNTGLWAHH